MTDLTHFDFWTLAAM